MWAESNPQAMLEMGKNARKEYEAKYTSERNFDQLMAIYAEAIAARSNKVKSE
jgi:glycosyltransferase involved in cell wall biosynthesis